MGPCYAASSNFALLLAAVVHAYGVADFPGLPQVGGGRSGRLSKQRSARTLPAAVLHQSCALQSLLNKHVSVCAVLQRPRAQTPISASAGRQILRHTAVPAAVRPEAAWADVPGLPWREPQQVPSCAPSQWSACLPRAPGGSVALSHHRTCLNSRPAPAQAGALHGCGSPGLDAGHAYKAVSGSGAGLVTAGV